MIGTCRLAVSGAFFLVIGCHGSTPTPEHLKTTPFVAKGSGVIGTWEGIQSDSPDSKVPLGNLTVSTTFSPDGTYSLTTVKSDVSMTRFGPYSYDDKTKKLTTSIKRATMQGNEMKMSGAFGNPQTTVVTWKGKDKITFVLGVNREDLTRK